VPTLLTSALSLPLVGPYGALAILNAHFKHRMGIVAPISIMNFLNLASQSGILIKDGRTLDLLNQVDTIVFDKTGTLTKEQPYVGSIYTCAAYDANAVLTFAAAAEYKQTHPIAKAILQEARVRQLPLPNINEAEYKVGYGLSVAIGQQLVQVGSDRFMEMTGTVIPAAIRNTLECCYTQGHSLVLVAVDNQLVGAIELCPTMRPEVKTIITQLRQRHHIKSIYIISGDHETPTRRLAQELSIDHYFAKALPENKADIIEQLQHEGKFVCYIGDGINDSIALKKSQVSVSLRGASTVATDTAQIVLMDESLKQFVDLFDLAQEFDGNMRTSFMCLFIPTLVGIGGVFFMSFGLVHTMILTSVGLSGGMLNAMVPLLKSQRKTPVPMVESRPDASTVDPVPYPVVAAAND
jgi:P-type E1-E2 ATPase